MQCDPASFARRADPADLREWMDGPCSYEEMRDCLGDLAQVNVVTLGHRPTLRWLRERLSNAGAAESADPLHVVDVGCGGGDFLRRLERWARRRHVALRLTGIDLNPLVIRAAREFTRLPYSFGARATESRIEWIAGDVYTHAFAQPPDLIVSSLVTHHMREPEIVRFLAWMEATARVGWFVNDLYRSAQACRLFAMLARVARWHRFVQHDGPVSIRRSFREDDWQRMLASAGIAQGAATVEKVFPSRLCVGRCRP